MESTLQSFSPYLARASRLVRSPRLLTMFIHQAGSKLAAEGSVGAALDSIRSDVKTSAELLRAWISGSYTGVATQSVVLLVAGLAYLIAPVDAMPDVLPGIGLIDDATVLSFVFGQLGRELEQFKLWRQRHDAARPTL